MSLDYTIFKNFHKNKDIKFYTYLNCPISSRIRNNVFWEKHLHDIFEKFINEKSIVIEGGCHIGAHTLKMALICEHIYAFEPFPASFDLLNSNVKINNLENVSIIKKGLSVREVEKLIKKPKKSKNTSEFHKYLDIENELSNKIGLKTKILFNKEKKNGSLTIKFKNLDQLEFIMKKFN